MSILYCMRQCLDYVELCPVTNRPVTISELDIDVQLVHQFSKIPGHKIKARIDNMDKLQDDVAW
jgi:hypothetical protein